jgi:hypothetical protein
MQFESTSMEISEGLTQTVIQEAEEKLMGRWISLKTTMYLSREV